jgi:hypothetical protein
MKTARPEVQRLVQSVMKYGSMEQEQKMIMLKEMRDVMQ